MRNMIDSKIEWIGRIPANWKIGKVKDVFIRKNFKANEENPIVLSLARSGIKIRDISTGEGQLAESYNNYNPVEIDDLLLNPMDLYSGANCSISKVSGVISPAYINLRARGDNNPTYYDYYFKTQYWSMAFFAHGKGVSFDNRWTLGIDTALNYFVPIPPSEEQNKIANYLDKKIKKIDNIIEKTKETIESYNKYKQSLITEVITKGLNKNVKFKKSRIDWIGDIPEHWKLSKIKMFTIKVGSGKTPKGDDNLYSEGDIFFLRSQNIYNTGLQLGENPTMITTEIDDEMANTRVYYNDILLNITGGSIGRCCIYNIKDKANVNQHVCIIRVDQEKIIPQYMHYFWISKLGEVSIGLYQTGGNREGMSADAIKNTYLPVIPIEEQKNIINYLENKCYEIDNLIQSKENIIEELEKYKKSLIYEYVTGKKEVI